MLIQFGPWRPDTPATSTNAAEATNVVPGVDSYHPQSSLQIFSTALDARCQGAIAVLDSSGSTYWFAGDATHLYTINTNTTDWTNVSRVGDYSTATTGAWSFVQYGDTIFAANYGDPLQKYSLGAAGSFADVGGVAPQAYALGVVKNFLVAINTVDTDGAIPQRVRWSGLDMPLSWTVDSVTLADFQDLLGDGGANKAIVAGLTQADAVILQERSVWRMTYQTTPLVFTFDVVEGVRGTPAPKSVIQVGGIVYYLGEDGFYAFDGAASTPIGIGRVNRTLFNDVDPLYLHRTSAVADINRKLIFWSYASTAAIAGVPDRILVFNWATGEWSRLNVATEFLWRSLSFGYTLEDLDVFGTVDTIDVSFDSRQWAGGNQQLSAFDSTHSTAHFSGQYLAATLTTPEQTLPEPQRLLVTETWPNVACSDGTTKVKVAVGRRTLANGTVSYVTATAMNSIGFCPQRTTDHYVRFRMSLTSSAVWDHAVGIDVRLTTAGWR